LLVAQAKSGTVRFKLTVQHSMSFAVLSVTTFWSFLREFSSLEGCGGGIGCAGPANLLRPPVYWIEVWRADIFSAPNEWTSTRRLRSHSLKRFKTLVF
jgi:hypothetical protein